MRESVTDNFLLKISATPARRRRACAFLTLILPTSVLAETCSAHTAVAGDEGIEPPTTVLETVVIPLN